MRTRLFVLVCVWATLGPETAHATDTSFLTPPVDAAISATFDDPEHPYAAGHRGIDYAVPPGSSVRAAAAGYVAFAGTVAGDLAITIEHDSGLETTYSELSEIFVEQGESVGEGTWIGRSGSAHGTDVPGLHFGVKVDGDYVDPSGFLGPVDTAGAIALAPLEPDAIEDRHVRTCKPGGELPGGAPAPNDNVVVIVGGITSATDGSGAPPDLFATVPALGYPESRIYEFSYRGPNGPGLHEPYGARDTYESIDVAAARLGDTLSEIARVHPGVDVDLIAHSQGGIVARTFLAQRARGWTRDGPRVEHLVTFASPHEGVPAAGEFDDLRKGSFASRIFAATVEMAAERTDAIPPPTSGSVPQLRTDSELLGSLARQDVLFGTQVLTMGITNDLLVPAVRTQIPGKPNVIVPASGVWGHSEIVSSSRALQVAHAFLSGAGVACAPDLGSIERNVPLLIDRGQSLIGEFVDGAISLLTPF